MKKLENAGRMQQNLITKSNFVPLTSHLNEIISATTSVSTDALYNQRLLITLPHNITNSKFETKIERLAEPSSEKQRRLSAGIQGMA